MIEIIGTHMTEYGLIGDCVGAAVGAMMIASILYIVAKVNQEYKLKDERNKALLSGELPYTIGGGIGQSRLCMLLMGNAHIGEVQSSVWGDDTRDRCRKAGINIL